MNERIQKIKQKHKYSVKNIPGFEDFIKSVQGQIEEDMKSTVAGSMMDNVNEVLKDVRKLLERRDQGWRDISAYLEFQRQELEKHSDKNDSVFFDVVEGLEKIAKSVHETQKVSITNPSKIKPTKNELKEAFGEALNQVEKLLLTQNQIPDGGSIRYDRNRQVSQIEEDFGNFILRTTYAYDSYGNVTSWQTERI